MLTKNDIKFIRSLSTRREREASGLFIAEGDKLVDQLAQTMQVEQIFRVGESCTASEMERISQLKTPTGTLALFRIAPPEPQLSGRVLVLDSVQDPGNLGTIVRTADWFGVRSIICSSQCADIYSPKVVQATMGAIARVDLCYTDIVEWLIAQSNRPIYGTFLERSTPLMELDFEPNAVLVMGNEGNGISPAVEKLVAKRLHIPKGQNGGGESLNVAIATAIILSRL